MTTKKIAAIILGITGVTLLALAWQSMSPVPALAGFGFMVTGHVFFHSKTV